MAKKMKYSFLALAMAFSDDNPQLFEAVFREGFDNDINDDEYTTSLMIAAKMENNEYVKLILNQQWMDLDYILKEAYDLHSKSNITALYHANHHKSKSDMLQIMIDKIYSLYSASIESGNPYTFKSHLYNLNRIVGIEYYSMLAIAAECNHDNLFRAILQNVGLDVHYRPPRMPGLDANEYYTTALQTSIPGTMYISKSKLFRETFVRMIFNAPGITTDYVKESGALKNAINASYHWDTAVTALSCFME
eukprot:493122_1